MELTMDYARRNKDKINKRQQELSAIKRADKISRGLLRECLICDRFRNVKYFYKNDEICEMCIKVPGKAEHKERALASARRMYHRSKGQCFKHLTKKCSFCKEFKRGDLFYNIDSTCKLCKSAYYKKRYAEDKETFLESNKIWHLENPNYAKEYTAKKLEELRSISPETYLHRTAKNRATFLKVPFSLEVSDLKIPEKCPIMGIPLKFNKGQPSKDSITMHRLVPSKGFVKGNISIVSYRAAKYLRDRSK